MQFRWPNMRWPRFWRIERLFATSDHVVLAAPSTDRTRRMVRGSVLDHAKPGLHLVNVARGDLIDEAALLRALDRGVLSGATLDVLGQEPPEQGHLLVGHPRVRVSSHLAGNSEQAIASLMLITNENISRYMRKQSLLNPIAA